MTFAIGKSRVDLVKCSKSFLLCIDLCSNGVIVLVRIDAVPYRTVRLKHFMHSLSPFLKLNRTFVLVQLSQCVNKPQSFVQLACLCKSQRN